MRKSGPHDRTRKEWWVKTTLQVKTTWERVRSSWQDKKGMMSQDYITWLQVKTRWESQVLMTGQERSDESSYITSQDKMRESDPHDRTRPDGWVQASWQVKTRWESQVLMTGQDWMDESRLHYKSSQDEKVRSSWQDKTGQDFIGIGWVGDVLYYFTVGLDRNGRQVDEIS